jgi:hypothetical protein
MQSHAGLLYLAKSTGKILLILENSQWTVPTFPRKLSLLEDAKLLLENYKQGKIIPIELYLSKDRGFEYGTYICLVDDEFKIDFLTTAWCLKNSLPPGLHNGLKSTLNNQIIRTKIDTIFELENLNHR